jgi:hypothetical protein
MLSPHGNTIGSFNIFEQNEHVQFAFDLSISNNNGIILMASKIFQRANKKSWQVFRLYFIQLKRFSKLIIDEALYIPPPKKKEIDPQNFLPQKGEIVTPIIATGNCLHQINIRGTVRCAVKRNFFIFLCKIERIFQTDTSNSCLKKLFLLRKTFTLC